jgi:hypothetical protein
LFRLHPGHQPDASAGMVLIPCGSAADPGPWHCLATPRTRARVR